jgi:hypothetical protein
MAFGGLSELYHAPLYEPKARQHTFFATLKQHLRTEAYAK